MRRLPALAFVPLLLLAVPPTLHAYPEQLHWDDCNQPPDHLGRYFECNTNQGYSTFVLSVVAPAGVHDVLAIVATLDVGPNENCTVMVPCPPVPPFPDWWEFGPGGCREGLLTVDAPPAGSSCPAVWQESDQPSRQIFYPAPLGSDVFLRTFSALIMGTAPQTLVQGTEYALMAFRLDYAKTVGAGACAGCGTIVWVTPRRIEFDLADGSTVVVPGEEISLGWQSMGGGWPVPVRTSTWGALKSVYR